MDPPEHAWYYDVSTNIIMATTTTVVRTYFNLGHMHEVAEPDIPLAPVVILETTPTSPLAPWDLLLSPLLDFELELIYPGLPSVEIQPQPVIPVIKLSSTTTPRTVTASLPFPEHHPGITPTYEEDLSKERSSAASCTPHEAESSRHARHIEVLNRQPRIIRTPFIPQGHGARGRRRSRLRFS